MAGAVAASGMNGAAGDGHGGLPHGFGECRVISWIISPAMGPTMCAPSTRSVLLSARIFTKPAVSPMALARPLAMKLNLARPLAMKLNFPTA